MAQPGIVQLLGNNLTNKAGESISTQSLSTEGKVIGIYFSAHWCPPCRGFTPKLAEWYEKFKKSDKGDKLEMVFVSSDHSEEDFKKYLDEMPWLALPFADREAKGKLSKKFKVQGIPTLVFVDGVTGELITRSGREKITSDPEGKEFPWHPKKLCDMMTGSLNSETGEVDFKESVKGKILALYFSAHWCPPCRGFTPKLVDTYNKLKADNKNIEVVFISSDRSEDQYKEYCSTMPWLCLPYKSPLTKELSEHFEVEGIPSLVLLDQNLEIITKNGRSAVMDDPQGKNFPWIPEPLQKISQSSVTGLNESACLVCFTGCEKVHADAAAAAMKDVAEQYVAELKQNKNSGLSELLFFYEPEDADGELADSIRDFLDIQQRTPHLLLIDIPEQRVYEHPEGPINKEVVEKIISDFKSESLQFTKLGH